MEDKRTGSLLIGEYRKYMIPAVLSAVGVSLGEFVDSMIVSRLLSADAFTIVNLGYPIVFAVCMIYTVTGIGGSLLFAESLGRKEQERASGIYTHASALALISSLVLLLILVLFHSHLGTLFGCPDEIRADFDLYIWVLTFFVPVGVVLINISYFLPVVGKPYMSMGIVVAVNVLNVFLDVVYIRFVGMGCEGAAAATLTSYIIVMICCMVIIRTKGIPLKLTGMKGMVKDSIEITKKGIPSGSVQAGYAATAIFCNYFMNMGFGLSGVMAMSLFGQLDSVVSIALTGIVDNNASFTSMLKGEGDYYGIRYLTRRVAVLILVVAVILSLLFGIFSRTISGFFNINDEKSLTLIATLVWIYVLHYPPRCILLLLRDLYNALDRSAYATALGVLDKVIGVPLVGIVLYQLIGGYGVIAAFPVSTLLILCMVFFVNRRIVKRSKGRYSPALLLDEQYTLKSIYSCSFDSVERTSDIGVQISEKCEEYSVDPGTLMKICLAVEEICLYISENAGADTPVDILVSQKGGAYIITCRSGGTPFYPINESSEDLSPNELILKKFFKIHHEYIFGLNSTRLVIGEEDA